MESTWVDRWNERYSKHEFAYGESPNNYLKKQLDKLMIGSILFPAEGEGRNAVYAARLGWKVFAFDISIEGKKKALQLAEKNKVSINYELGDLSSLNYDDMQFDVVALIYAHFPADIKSQYHKTLVRYLRPGGIVIFEAFSKRHLDYVLRNEKVGGPRDLESLFSVEEIQSDFQDFEVIELSEEEIELKEGEFHNGTASVIRFVGRKVK